MPQICTLTKFYWAGPDGSGTNTSQAKAAMAQTFVVKRSRYRRWLSPARLRDTLDLAIAGGSFRNSVHLDFGCRLCDGEGCEGYSGDLEPRWMWMMVLFDI